MTQSDMPPPYASHPPQGPYSVTLTPDASNSLLAVVTPPVEPAPQDEKTPGKRAPVDICCVIDVSGSMGEHAPAPMEEGKPKELTGLSVLDVTKHAMKTIVATMQEDDRIALVTFSNSASVVANFTTMTEAGKARLIKSVESLVPLDTTNLWDGLKVGMNLLNKIEEGPTAGSSAKQVGGSVDQNRLSSLFILTDGMPNVNPPRGHIPMLQNYLESHPDSKFTISTFGFGYSLDSKLLSEIAAVGGGRYSFIPDSGMVGTNFVHAVANLYATYATRAVMKVELPENVKLKKLKGDLPVVNTSWGAQIELGDLQYGQERSLILEFEGKDVKKQLPETTVTVNAQPWFESDAHAVSVTYTPTTSPPTATEYHIYTQNRLDLVSYLYTLCQEAAEKRTSFLSKSSPLTKAASHFSTIAKQLKQEHPNNSNLIALAEDIGGEIHMGVENEANWKKWGRHYLLSIACAHQRQQCSNFKDAGLQIYGANSPLFIKSRDAVDAAFDNLPPPVPSKKATEIPASYRAQGQTSYTTLSSMRQYNQRIGPCFSGDCNITLANGDKISIDRLTRGTLVWTPLGNQSVAAIVKTIIPSGVLHMSHIGDLKITPYHPILDGGDWKFPMQVAEPVLTKCDAIYSVLLQPNNDAEANAIEISGMTCVTLGHGLVQQKVEPLAIKQDVRVHPFFGSYAKVLDAVAKLPGFYDAEGVVTCTGVVRDEKDNLVCGFTNAPDELYEEVSTFQLSGCVSISA